MVGEGWLEGAEKEIGGVSSKGLQLARELAPEAIDVISGNPHTLAEWLIYLALLPITLPLSFMIWAMRWIFVEAPLLVNQIKKIVGLERTGPIGSALERCAGGIPILGPIIDALTSPSNEFDLGIMEGAATSVADGGISAMMGPITRPIEYCMNRMMPNALVSPDQAAVLFHKGYFDQGSATDTMTAYGFDGGQSQAIIDATRDPPDFMAIITMLNRGYIDSGTAYSWIHQSGTDTDFINPLLQLRQFVPSMGEIAGYMSAYAYSTDIRGQFGLDEEFPTNSMADASKNGASETEARNTWLEHWTFPGPGEAANMMYRGLITREEALALLRAGGIPPTLRTPLLDSQQSIFTQRYIRNLYKYGIVSYAGVEDAYKKIGFNDERAKNMADLAVKMVNPISQNEIADTYKTAYADGLLDYNTAYKAFTAAGHSDYEAKIHLAIADYTKGGNILKEVESYVRTSYLNGDMTLDSGMTYLDTYGITSERKTVLRELWFEQKQHSIKHVSESDARNAYQIGLINAAQLRAFLLQLNYAEDDISIIISIDNATMQKPQSTVIAPITTATGKAKSFTKAELKNMYIDGIIDGNTWWLEMASLGYTDAQIEAYAELITAKAATTTKAS